MEYIPADLVVRNSMVADFDKLRNWEAFENNSSNIRYLHMISLYSNLDSLSKTSKNL